MSRAKRIEEATALATINIMSLEIIKLYPIVSATRMTTK